MPKKKTTKVPRPWAVADPERVRAVQELRRSSAASPHLSRADKMTRAEAKSVAIEESTEQN
ncbi:MAG: hypothetical protein LBK54_07370 [Propionibacteriaceae bacterium]|jgi:hypothetical protein|nr:hypothetical protein [Propionibacteriaceae bacterium]